MDSERVRRICKKRNTSLAEPVGKTGTSRNLKRLIAFVAACICLTAILGVIYRKLDSVVFLSLYITALTISYHFAMRLIVGEAVTVIYKKRKFDYDSFWFRQHGFEPGLYRMFHVKSWKDRIITAKPEQFDIKNRSMDELLHNIAQAEVVHEIIMVLSFVPLVMIKWYGEAEIFIITSTVACLFDCSFVIVQRFNRPRVLALKKRMNTKKYLK